MGGGRRFAASSPADSLSKRDQRRQRKGELPVARNYIFSLIWRCYGPKWDILDYWGTNIFCILSYYILSKDKGL